QDPLGSLAEALDAEVEYDPSSRKPLVGPLITFARRVTIGLVKWWMGAILERQERVNHLLAAAYDYEGQMAPRFGARLDKLERDLKEWRAPLAASHLDSPYAPAPCRGRRRRRPFRAAPRRAHPAGRARRDPPRVPTRARSRLTARVRDAEP